MDRFDPEFGPPVLRQSSQASEDSTVQQRAPLQYDPFFGPPVLLGEGGKGWEANYRPSGSINTTPARAKTTTQEDLFPKSKEPFSTTDNDRSPLLRECSDAPSEPHK